MTFALITSSIRLRNKHFFFLCVTRTNVTSPGRHGGGIVRERERERGSTTPASARLSSHAWLYFDVADGRRERGGGVGDGWVFGVQNQKGGLMSVCVHGVRGTHIQSYRDVDVIHGFNAKCICLPSADKSIGTPTPTPPPTPSP